MIQRKQTLFLLAMVLCNCLLLFIPFCRYLFIQKQNLTNSVNLVFAAAMGNPWSYDVALSFCG